MFYVKAHLGEEELVVKNLFSRGKNFNKNEKYNLEKIPILSLNYI